MIEEAHGNGNTCQHSIAMSNVWNGSTQIYIDIYILYVWYPNLWYGHGVMRSSRDKVSTCQNMIARKCNYQKGKKKEKKTRGGQCNTYCWVSGEKWQKNQKSKSKRDHLFLLLLLLLLHLVPLVCVIQSIMSSVQSIDSVDTWQNNTQELIIT